MLVQKARNQSKKKAIMRKALNKFLWVLIAINFQSCGQSIKSNSSQGSYDGLKTRQISSRDSIFILFTVKEWGKQNWYTWEDYSKMYRITNDQVEYFIAA